MNSIGILPVRVHFTTMKKTITIIAALIALGLNGRAEDKVDFAKSIQGVLEALSLIHI